MALALQACRAAGDTGAVDAGGSPGHAGGQPAGSGGAGEDAGVAGGAGGGRGGDSGGVGGAGGVVAGPDVSGRWAMIAFEDPVAVGLREMGGVLTGEGCCTGLDSSSGPPAPFMCCGPVNGEIATRHATFWLTFELGSQSIKYWSDAFVSANGQRMTGRFKTMTSQHVMDGDYPGIPVAWVRIGFADNWLPVGISAAHQVLTTRSGAYDLVLSEERAAGNDFAPNQTYRLGLGYRFVTGDLGVFWDGEMSWNASDQTMVVGPVPETEPRLPVALALHFQGPTLTSVDATMSSGARYSFQATASQP